jgi:diadenosine tetraphosphatase ApaH/serine/threonine PP2A family protein phosphatase
VGHTHELVLAAFDGKRLISAPLQEGPVSLASRGRYIVNVGSVGQPRDGDNRSKYVIYDDAKAIIDVRFIPYDISAVVKKIMAAGLPEIHALRLK